MAFGLKAECKIQSSRHKDACQGFLAGVFPLASAEAGGYFTW